MPDMEQVSIDLTPELAADLRRAVDQGYYGSVSEIVQDALRDWRFRHAAETTDAEVLRLLVREGVDSGPALDGDEVFARLRAKFGATSHA